MHACVRGRWLLECLRFIGVFQLHTAPKSHHLVSQPLREQPHVCKQLPFSLQTMSSLLGSCSCAWGSSSLLNPKSFSCCWWWGTVLLGFFCNHIAKQTLLAQDVKREGVGKSDLSSSKCSSCSLQLLPRWWAPCKDTILSVTSCTGDLDRTKRHLNGCY